jgi:hypothetical protein
MRNKRISDGIKLKGFARLQLADSKSGRIVGDSGWMGPNQVVNLGFQDYIVSTIAGLTGSKTISYMAIGTGTVPASDATVLAGETGTRITTTNTVVASKTLQSTCQFLGADMKGTCTIQNVALVNSVSGGSIVCGMTYATSQWALIKWCQTMVTLFKALPKFGGSLLKKTIPSQVFNINILKKGVETRWEALLNGVEGIVRTTGRLVELNRNILALALSKSNNIANQNVNATFLNDGVERVVTFFKKLREFGGHLLNETIPSRALVLTY